VARTVALEAVDAVRAAVAPATKPAGLCARNCACSIGKPKGPSVAADTGGHPRSRPSKPIVSSQGRRGRHPRGSSDGGRQIWGGHDPHRIPAAPRTGAMKHAVIPPTPRPSEEAMRFGGIILVIWLIIGAIAAGQRHYFDSGTADCAKSSTTFVTVIVGPLNYIGVNPKVSCPTPSK
jgi:hypothetical protein